MISADSTASGNKTPATDNGQSPGLDTPVITVKTVDDLVALVQNYAAEGKSRAQANDLVRPAAKDLGIGLVSLSQLIRELMPDSTSPAPRKVAPNPMPPVAAPKAVNATTETNPDKSGFRTDDEAVLALVRTFHGRGKTRKEVIDHFLGIVDRVYGESKPEAAISPEKPMESSMESCMERSPQPLSLSFHHDHHDHQDHYGPLESRVPLRGDTTDLDEETRNDPPKEESFGVVQGMPLHEFVLFAVEEQKRAWEASDGGPWQSALWRFTRLLTAHPDLQGLEPYAALGKVKAAMRKAQKGLPESDPRREGDPWVMFLEHDADEAEHEFQHVWDKVEIPPGGEVLPLALARSRACELGIPAEFRRRHSKDYRRFISLAGWLQVIVGAEPIVLPVKRIAELLGLKSHRNVSNFRQWAVADGLLEEVCKGSKAAKMAGAFVFDVESFPVLRDRAKPGTVELWQRYQQGAA